MSGRTRMSVGVAVAATTSLALVGVSAGSAISAPHATKTIAATPKLKVKVSKHKFKVHGPSAFQPGTVALTGIGKGGNGAFEIVRLKHGYTYHQLRQDIKTFGASYGPKGPSKSGLKAFHRALANSTEYGGLAPSQGQKLRGSVKLNKAGTYYLFNDTTNTPKPHPVLLSVFGPKAHRAPVATSATVKATKKARWHGDKTLPAKGTIKFKNISKGMHKSPHFVDLERVKPGTTRKDVLDFFANGHGRPPFAVPGPSVDSDIVGPHQSMTLRYKLHRGSYALMCFFPDPMTGIPHAFMGMVRIVNLK
ncbi:MAG: hypothetical protein JO246_10020 [Frankiaceae bacterium]|nr:hypothetical protein [Frankiaceae bacterium]